MLGTELPDATILAVEQDHGSFIAAEKNLQARKNVTVMHADLAASDVPISPGSLDLIVSNPPFHATTYEKSRFFKAAFDALRPEGELFIVSGKSFTGQFSVALRGKFTLIAEEKNGLYAVGRYRKTVISDVERANPAAPAS